MDEQTNNKATTGNFSRFNMGLSYILGNVFKFIFTIGIFVAKISGLILLTFPFVIFGMCLVTPESAIKTLEAFAKLIQIIVDIFKEVS